MTGPFYRIKNWDETFETRDTKRCRNLSWIKLSVQLGGSDYSDLVRGHEDGPTHFAAWVAMLQVAANTYPYRGILVRNDGRSHTPQSLGVLTGIPSQWFSSALARLCDEEDLGWVEVLQQLPEVSTDSPATSRKSPVFASESSSSEENKNKKENKKGNDIFPRGSVEASSELPEVSGKIPAAPQAPLEPSPLETELQKTAQVLRERHPKHRTCGQKEVEKQLRAIVKPLPSKERIPMIHKIDENHKATCDSFDWKKDNGQFVKGLANWLAPSLQRYLTLPPEESDLAKNNTLFGGRKDIEYDVVDENYGRRCQQEMEEFQKRKLAKEQAV